jgi:hypothetical protein
MELRRPSKLQVLELNSACSLGMLDSEAFLGTEVSPEKRKSIFVCGTTGDALALALVCPNILAPWSIFMLQFFELWLMQL